MDVKSRFVPGLFVPALFWASSAFCGSPLLLDPASPRAMSLTRAFPMEMGIHSIFSNPGGLANIGNPTLAMTHTQLAADTRLDALGLGLPVSKENSWGTFALSLLALTQKPLEGSDESGAPTGSFAAWDSVAGLSYAKRLGKTHAGMSVKYIHQAVADESATGFAADLGFQRQLPSALLGMSVQNLGPRMKFIEESYNLPLSYNLGVTYFLSASLRLHAATQYRPHDKTFDLGIGAELGLGQSLVLRSGLLNSVSRAALPGDNPMAKLGFGMGWRIPGSNLSFDYALNPGGADLGMSHRLSMQLHWGSNAPRRAPDEPEYRWQDFEGPLSL